MSDGQLEGHLSRWLKGQPDAIRWCADLILVTAVWDDLIDDDKDPTPKDINDAFSTALLWMPSNPFYMAHQGVLHPILVAAYRNWTIANEMEEASEDLAIAFAIRSSYIDALTTCAACLGGYEWSVTVNREARRFFHREGFETYQKNLETEKAERNVRKQRRRNDS